MDDNTLNGTTDDGSDDTLIKSTDDDNKYYAADVRAQAFAENKLDPDKLDEAEDIPVTTGDLSIGDLDEDKEPEDPALSDDEENMAGGEDNVVAEEGEY